MKLLRRQPCLKSTPLDVVYFPKPEPGLAEVTAVTKRRVMWDYGTIIPITRENLSDWAPKGLRGSSRASLAVVQPATWSANYQCNTNGTLFCRQDSTKQHHSARLFSCSKSQCSTHYLYYISRPSWYCVSKRAITDQGSRFAEYRPPFYGDGKRLQCSLRHLKTALYISFSVIGAAIISWCKSMTLNLVIWKLYCI